ncbi:MAG TPA: CpsB/CapC family capsule biosynthesis tyrosine phosphatase [Gemmatimonadales bacterium]|nr:CpsB/CapC family capsule biosynthesis tyrosine phosphatase [Gemmatimonadales bacterium]
MPLHPSSAFPIVDLHSHLVPGVDDGTATIAESLVALTGLYREGVRTVITTPHLLVPNLTDAGIDQELERHRRAFDQLMAALAGRDDVPGLGLGQEIWAPDAAAVSRVVRRPDVGLSSKYLLVEFGFELVGNHNDVVRAVLDAGRPIVIAHPERYHYLPGHDPLEVMQTWQELGALLQVNVGSLTGHYNRSSPGSERLTWRMVELGLIDLLSSDHHGPRRDGVSPSQALEALIARGQLGLAERAMGEVPGLIARNESIGSRLPR